MIEDDDRTARRSRPRGRSGRTPDQASPQRIDSVRSQMSRDDKARSGLVGSSSSEARAFVLSILDRELKLTLAGVELGSERDKSMRELTRTAATLYEGRILRELIQNAYDGSGQNEGAEVLLRLDVSSGGVGVVEVANTGSGFLIENVDAIVNPALSSKRPGNSIGHKGLGFRSVELVSDDPQIYSVAETGLPGRARFDGYCFRFADEQAQGDATSSLAASATPSGPTRRARPGTAARSSPSRSISSPRPRKRPEKTRRSGARSSAAPPKSGCFRGTRRHKPPGLLACFPRPPLSFYCPQIVERNRTSLGRPNRPIKMAICFREREHPSQASADPASPQRPDRLGILRVWGPIRSNSSPNLMERNTPKLGTESRTPYPDFPSVKC